MSPPPDDGRDPKESPLAPEEGASAEDGPALSPDELDIQDEENVVQLDEDRFVIGTDERPDVPADAGGGSSAGATGDAGGGKGDGEPATGAGAQPSSTGAEPGTVESSAVKQALEADLQAASARYGFHVTAKAEDAISHQQVSSDDVGTVFDGLLRWYAQQLTTETAVEDVLGILLTESNVRVRYSPSCLQAILEAYDLGPDDTIADLVEAVQDDRGMVFPPENV